MAFNWQTFRTRTLTAIVFVIVMMVGLLWNRWSFFILFSIIHFGCWMEYQQLVKSFYPDYRTITPLHTFAVPLAGWCLMFYFTNDELQLFRMRLTEAGFWAGLILLVLFPVTDVLIKKNIAVRNYGYSLFGLLYISLSFAFLINLRNHWIEAAYRLNMAVPLLIIFTLWINDTMAYIVGSLIGKTPLSKISPKKTWEGTVGGIILAVLIMGTIAYLTHYLAPVHAMVIAAIAAVSGTLGDLFESKLKRMAGVKDSGAIMPGHGGFLDRFDSLLFAVTPIWFYAVFFL